MPHLTKDQVLRRIRELQAQDPFKAYLLIGFREDRWSYLPDTPTPQDRQQAVRLCYPRYRCWSVIKGKERS